MEIELSMKSRAEVTTRCAKSYAKASKVDSHDGNCVGDRPAGLTPKLTGSMSMPWL